MPKFVSAREGPARSVVYVDSEGKEWIYKGGNRPWRNNNPGNLIPGAVANRNGAIGRAGGFAVFPDYTFGHAALVDSLRTSHGHRDIPGLMKKYTPPSENDTNAYILFIRKQTGIKDDRKVKDFSAGEFELLWKAIEKMEGWGKSEGTVNESAAKKKIVEVRKNKRGTIESYLIQGLGWVAKEEGIRLTRLGRVDAVIATSRSGNCFLRGRPHHEIT